MLTTLEMARAEFGFYAAHIALYNGEVEPLHGHTLLPQLQRAGLMAAELELPELLGTSATPTSAELVIIKVGTRAWLPGRPYERRPALLAGGVAAEPGRRRPPAARHRPEWLVAADRHHPVDRLDRDHRVPRHRRRTAA